MTQGLNPGLLHCRQILYCLSHQGSPTFTILCQFQLESKVKQSDIYIYIYIYIYLYFFRYFSYVGDYRVLSTLCYTVDPY